MKNIIFYNKETLRHLLTMQALCSLTLTSCVDNQDNAGGGGGGDKDKKFEERLTPVVDPNGNSLGTVAP